MGGKILSPLIQVRIDVSKIHKPRENRKVFTARIQSVSFSLLWRVFSLATTQDLIIFICCRALIVKTNLHVSIHNAKTKLKLYNTNMRTCEHK